jgi:ubiquinone/menaquinone biosynthesis C-methylase UbiE
VTNARAVITRGAFPHQFAWLLHFPLRRAISSPKRLVERLPLRENSSVLEVGPGSGYFSVELARHLPNGVLHLVDLQPEMLAKARRKLTAGGYCNVRYAAVDASTVLPFMGSQFDVVLLASVLGEVSDQDACLASLHHVLRPDGVLAVHESVPDPDRIPFSDLVALARRHDFELGARHGSRFSYMALFRKRSTPGAGADSRKS